MPPSPGACEQNSMWKKSDVTFSRKESTEKNEQRRMLCTVLGAFRQVPVSWWRETTMLGDSPTHKEPQDHRGRHSPTSAAQAWKREGGALPGAPGAMERGRDLLRPWGSRINLSITSGGRGPSPYLQVRLLPSRQETIHSCPQFPGLWKCVKLAWESGANAHSVEAG